MADERDSTTHAFEQIQLQEMTASVSETRARNCHPSLRRNYSKRSFLAKVMGWSPNDRLLVCLSKTGSRIECQELMFLPGVSPCIDGVRWGGTGDTVGVKAGRSPTVWPRAISTSVGAFNSRNTRPWDSESDEIIYWIIPFFGFWIIPSKSESWNHQHFSLTTLHTSALGRPLQVERVTLSLCSSLAHWSSETWPEVKTIKNQCVHKYAQFIAKYSQHLVISDVSDWMNMSAVFCSVTIWSHRHPSELHLEASGLLTKLTFRIAKMTWRASSTEKVHTNQATPYLEQDAGTFPPKSAWNRPIHRLPAASSLIKHNESLSPPWSPSSASSCEGCRHTMPKSTSNTAKSENAQEPQKIPRAAVRLRRFPSWNQLHLHRKVEIPAAATLRH